jgi:GNAT superfamily N-acetyltransferase
VELTVRPTSDPEAVHALLTECGLDLRDRFGLSHWLPAYPLPLLRGAVGQGNVHEVVANEGSLVATFTVSPEAPPYYGDVPWSPEGEPAVYVSRLAVRPAEQGRGLGRWCMAWIEDDARRDGFAAVRLDAYAGHARLLRFYRSLGYDERGTFVANARPLVCFEKVLRPQGALTQT